MQKPTRKRSHVGEWCAYRTPPMVAAHTVVYFHIVEEHPTLPMVRIHRPVGAEYNTFAPLTEGWRRPRWVMEQYITDYDKDETTLRERVRKALTAEANQHQEGGSTAEIHQAETAVASREPNLPMHGLPKEGSGHPPCEGQGGSTAI